MGIAQEIHAHFCIDWQPGGHTARTSLKGGHPSPPQVGTPQVDTSQVGTPLVGTPQVGTPQVDTPQVGTPLVGTPQVGTPQVGISDGVTPLMEQSKALKSPRCIRFPLIRIWPF